MTRPHTDQKDRDLLDDGGVALSVEPANDDDAPTYATGVGPNV